MTITRQRPGGRELFRTCVWMSLIGGTVGGAALYAAWVLTDYDPDAGRQFAYIGRVLVGILAAAVVLHYPWGPTWAAANGCRPDEPAV